MTGTHRSSLNATDLLIGVDDTDNLTSKGTGLLVQRLLACLEAEGLGTALGATRHQLLVDPRIPYTSHNSSACLAWSATADVTDVIRFASQFLETECATGSDPGLAVATPSAWATPSARGRLVDWGGRAKVEVLDQGSAHLLAQQVGIHLSGHGGTNGGVIGAMAAVGLHLSGADGLFLWMPGIRTLTGHATYGDLRRLVPIDVALDPAGREPLPDDVIELGEWVRPVLVEGRAVLLLQPAVQHARPPAPNRWEVSPRDVVKQH
jgi:hypothetical protein